MLLWIFEYLTTFLECTFCAVFCNTFSQKRDGVTRFNLVMINSLIAIAVTIVNRIQLFSAISSVFIVILLAIAQCAIRKEKNVKVIALTLLYVIIVLACDFASVTMFSNLRGYLIEDYVMTTNLYRVECIIISKSLLVVVLILINREKKNFDLIKKKYWIYITFICMVVFCMMFIQFSMIMNNNTSALIKNFSIMYFVIMVILAISIIYALVTINKESKNRQDMKLIMLKNKMLEQNLIESKLNLEKWKREQHDLKNNLVCLEGLLEEKEYDRVKEYVAQLKKETETKYDMQIRTGNKIVDIIMNSKKIYAEQNEVSFEVTSGLLPDIGISDTDLCAILGNMCDNAIEAAKISKGKVNITIKVVNNMMYINIKNTSYVNPFESDFVTSKKNKERHGIGIKSVKAAIEKYGGSLKMNYENGIMTSKVILNL